LLFIALRCVVKRGFLPQAVGCSISAYTLFPSPGLLLAAYICPHSGADSAGRRIPDDQDYPDDWDNAAGAFSISSLRYIFFGLRNNLREIFSPSNNVTFVIEKLM